MNSNLTDDFLPFDTGPPRVSLGCTAGEVVSSERKPAQDDASKSNPIAGSLVADVTSVIRQSRDQSKNKRKKRRILKMGTWNIRTMKQMGKLHLLVRELRTLDIDACGLCEVRWTGEGHFTHEDSTIIYSGGTDGQRGVAVILMKSMKKSLESYNAISDRILVVKLNTKPQPTVLIQVYAPTLNQDDSEHEDFYDKLQAIVESVKSHEVCMIMGDFNAKIGEGRDPDHGVGQFGLGVRNSNGDRLAEFCHINEMVITNTLFNHHKRNRYTWISPDGQVKNQIDFILISRKMKASVLDSKTRPGPDADSDHNLVVAKIRLKAHSKKNKQALRKYAVEKLQDDEHRKAYLIETENRFEALVDTITEEQTPNELLSNMEKVWRQSAEKIIGYRHTKKDKPWITTETLDLADAKRKAKTRPEKREEYRMLKRKLQWKIREDKKKWIESECQMITENDRLNNSKKVFQQLKRVKQRKFQPKQMAINDENGSTLTTPDSVLKRWKQYGERLFARPDTDTEQYKEAITESEPPPLTIEVEKALKRLKDGKSPGLDNIPAELFKNSGKFGLHVIHQLCIKIWMTNEWPDGWKKQEFVMLYKSGSPKDCSNYRTIALISHLSKILLIIILNRIKGKIEDELPYEQAGYRSNRSTCDMLACLQMLIEKTIAEDGDLHLLFIDYSKAFDSVSQDQLFNIMEKMGFPGHIINLLKSLYTNQAAVIRWNNSHSEQFYLSKGVRQGCILSPYLFNIYTEQVMREAEISELGVLTRGKRISNLRFADDTVLIDESEEGINELVNRVNTAGERRMLKINAKKTKGMTIGSSNVSYVVAGNVIEKVNKFKYLGSYKERNANCNTDVRARIAMAKTRTTELTNIWKDKSMPLKLKVKLVKVLIWPVLMYGCEGWTIRRLEENQINASEMWIYRRVLRISWTERRTNESVLQQLGVRKELLGRIIERKLTFFGHQLRHPNLDGFHNILHHQPIKRKRGRPQINWKTNIKSWLNVDLTTASRQATDRDEYRTWCRRARELHT